MKEMYYVGMDIHKKNISYCIKKADGKILDEGNIASEKEALLNWAGYLPQPWTGAMEATLFTGWIYDTLLPEAFELKVANSLRLKAISCGKKKTDKIDARTIGDILRANLLPECYMAPKDIRDLRRVLRFRNYLMRIATSLKNKTAGILMECGVQYNKKKLHGKKYFKDLLGNLEDVPDSVKEMMFLSHTELKVFEGIQKSLLRHISEDELLKNRLNLLRSIPGVGEITALSWALEIGEPERFSSIRKAVSYCGLCSALKESAGKTRRGPLSKQRNKHIQWILIEAAKLAPRYNLQLADVHAREVARGNKNRATIAVARKLVSYLLAVDKTQRPFSYR